METKQARSDLPSGTDYRLSRAQLLTEGYKGGAAALLAFVQATWGEHRALANLALGGIGFMIAALFFAMLVPFLRFHHSWLAEEYERRPHARRAWQIVLRVAYQICQYLSAGLFLIGAGGLVWKGLALP